MSVRRAALLAWFIPVGLVYAGLVAYAYHGDAHIYWSSGLTGYPTEPLEGMVYPPPLKMLFWPAHLVPFEVFYAGWLALLLAVMRWCMGPWLMLAFICPGALGWHAMASGNVAVLIGAGIALGVSRPAGWLVPALTKVTPGIGLGWLLLVGQWREAARAGGMVLVICGASFVISPGLWADWLNVMALNAATTSAQQGFSITNVPLAWRVAASALLVALSAWRGVAWPLPIAGCYALGWIGDTSTLVCLGTVRLLRHPLGTERLADRLSSPVCPDPEVEHCRVGQRPVAPDGRDVARVGRRVRHEVVHERARGELRR